MTATAMQPDSRRRWRFRWLYRLEAELEPFMFLLALTWLWLFVMEVTSGLQPWQETAIHVIWAAFIAEFLLKLYLAPRRGKYILHNWLTVIALAIPAFRVFRLLRALRVLQAARVASTTRIVRALTSSRRFYRDLQEAQGEVSAPEMNVGIVVMKTPAGDEEQLHRFARGIVASAQPELERASGLPWHVDMLDGQRLESDDARSPSDFLDEASMRMAEGPYDVIIVVTDAMLLSRHRKVRAGLASPTARIATLSTRPLVTTPRGQSARSLLDPAVIANGAAVLLHLVGHLAGLRHSLASEIMRPFAFREARRKTPRFNDDESADLQRHRERLPERELHGSARLAALLFHVLMAMQHPLKLLRPLLRNKAVLLPLSLPGLATAAVAPSFLLVFTAEIWDVGLGMSNATAVAYAALSIIGATLFLTNVQSLFLPRRERNVLTEHLAVANSVIFLSILLACVGLFLIVGTLMLVIEQFVFPSDLMQTWPTLQQPVVELSDKLRLSAFIATIGVSTGALAGGLESRAVIRNLALFEDET